MQRLRGRAVAAGRGVRGAQAGRARGRLHRPAGHRRPGRRAAPGGRCGRAGDLPRRCCSTSTRTPATPSGCCCGRCSAPCPGAPVRPDDPAVTAVGDPCQSIYGWRGASAGNLLRFRTDFPSPDGPADTLRPADQLPQPARGADPGQRGLRTAARRRRPGRSRARRSASCGPARGPEPGDVRVALLPDVAAELDWMADAVAEQWAAARADRQRGADLGGAGPAPGRHGPDRHRAARPRAAGRGGRPGRAAGHPRGARPGVRAAPGRRPAGRAGRGAAAHRRPLAARGGRPGRALGARPGDRPAAAAPVRARAPRPSWPWARCPGSTPSRPGWSTPSTTPARRRTTRRPASPGSGGWPASWAGCAPAARPR